MSMLRSKLYEHELEKKRAATKKIEDSKLDIDFGSQIRSYVLQPYRMIKDHRTKLEVGDVDRVIDGDLQIVHKRLSTHAAGEKQVMPEPVPLNAWTCPLRNLHRKDFEKREDTPW